MRKEARLCKGRDFVLPQITDNHNLKNCKKTCNVCKQKHPFSLHGYVPKKKAGVTTKETFEADKNKTLSAVDNGGKNYTASDMKCVSTGISSKIISMCVVPIRVNNRETKKEISTYTMLDNCSQGCLIKENIKRSLGVTGRNTVITIKTLNREQEIESTMIAGLRIGSSGVEGKRD